MSHQCDVMKTKRTTDYNHSSMRTILPLYCVIHGCTFVLPTTVSGFFFVIVFGFFILCTFYFEIIIVNGYILKTTIQKQLEMIFLKLIVNGVRNYLAYILFSVGKICLCNLKQPGPGESAITILLLCMICTIVSR